VKTLQAQLAEKDAMIGVLQKHSSLSPTSSVSSLLSSPVHSPRPSGIVSTPASLGGSPPSSAGSSRQGSQIDANFNASHVHAKSSKIDVVMFLLVNNSEKNTTLHPVACNTLVYICFTFYVCHLIFSDSTGSAVPSLMTGKESQLRDLQHKIATQVCKNHKISSCEYQYYQ